MSRFGHAAGIGAVILALAINTPTTLPAQVTGDQAGQQIDIEDDGFDWGLLGLLGLAGLLGLKRRDDRDVGARRP